MHTFDELRSNINNLSLHNLAYIKESAKKLVKAMSQAGGRTASKNQYLVELFAVKYTLDQNKLNQFISCLRIEVESLQSNSPKGAMKALFMIDLVSTHRSTITSDHAVHTANKHAEAFVNDKNFITAALSSYNVMEMDCGHWGVDSGHYRDSENYHRIHHVCADCAERMNGSDLWVRSNDYFISLANHVTIYTNQGPMSTDVRNPAMVYSDMRGRYESLDYNPYQGLIGDYHRSKRHGFNKILSPWFKSHKRLFGCELEVELKGSTTNTQKAKAAGRIHEILNPSLESGEYCYFERDGSVQNGFEIVTQPAGLDVHLEKFKAFLTNDAAKQGMRSHESGSCGFHVHVDRECLSQTQIFRIQSFMHNRENEVLIKKIARRYSNGYSQVHPSMGKMSPYNKGSESRYDVVNITSRNTIEFRVFRGSLRYESIAAALQFVNALLDFCTPGNVSIKDFNSEGFKAFIALPDNLEDTKYLRKYLSISAVNSDTTDLENLAA